jgi:hypothetical protein
MITGIVIYLIGFLLTLTFFKYFGVKIGFDYTNNTSMDDWNSNEQAFTAFALLWFAVIPMLLIMGIIKMIFKFSKWFLKR